MNAFTEDLPASILSSLDVAVLEHVEHDTFRLRGQPPEWFGRLVPDSGDGTTLNPGSRLVYLEHFLEDAHRFWQEDSSNDWLSSGPWTEVDDNGYEWVLEAVALSRQGHKILLLKFPTSSHERLQDILQQGRSQNVEYSRLIKEINKREILLHCIVHDLSTPLAGIKGSLTLLKEDQMVRPNGLDLLDIGLNQVSKMQTLIKGILNTFSREVQPLVPHMIDSGTAPSVWRHSEEIVRLLEPLAHESGVDIQVSAEPVGEDGSLVAADPERLDRVLLNLIDNALRYAPSGSTVDVRVVDESEIVRTEIRDEGPGVAASQVNELFDRFTQGDSGGQAGLGLYFCRIAVDDWGGRIGYKPNVPRGSTFWFEVPKIRRPAASA